MNNLTTCSDCGGSISTRAANCPTCGAPTGEGIAHKSVNILQVFTGFVAFVLFWYLLYAINDVGTVCSSHFTEESGIGYFILLVIHAVIGVPILTFANLPSMICEADVSNGKNLGLIWLAWIIVGLFSVFFDRLLRSQDRK